MISLTKPNRAANIYISVSVGSWYPNMKQLRRFDIYPTQDRWVRRGTAGDHTTYFIVQTFRCDFIGSDGHCIRRDELKSPSLEAAIEACLALLPLPAFSACVGFELWHGSKCLHRHGRSLRSNQA
jgi:hypothetical protein